MKKKYCVLLDASTGADGKQMAEKLKKTMQRNEVRFVDFQSVKNYGRFLECRDQNEELVVAGDDRTLHHFVNAVNDRKIPNTLYYYVFGENCDFAREIGLKAEEKPREIARYLHHLPKVTVNGKDSLFVNAVGYGADGAAIEMKTKKVKGNVKRELMKNILFRSKPYKAEVEIDGEKIIYHDVWMAPMMFGRFECSGMQPATDQKRLHKEHQLTLAVVHGKNRLKAAAAVRAMYKGKKVCDKSVLVLHRGKRMTVAFDKPATLHMDGEVIPSVHRYDIEAFGERKE